MGQESPIYLGPDVSMSQSGDSRPQRRLLLASRRVLRFPGASDLAGRPAMPIHGLAAHHHRSLSAVEILLSCHGKRERVNAPYLNLFFHSLSLYKKTYILHASLKFCSSCGCKAEGFRTFHATAPGFHSVFPVFFCCGDEPQSLVDS